MEKPDQRTGQHIGQHPVCDCQAQCQLQSAFAVLHRFRKISLTMRMGRLYLSPHPGQRNHTGGQPCIHGGCPHCRNCIAAHHTDPGHIRQVIGCLHQGRGHYGECQPGQGSEDLSM